MNTDHVPYVEFGDYAALNNENGGVIDKLKEDEIVDLDSKLQNQSLPDWCSTKAMISTWLKDAVTYELWVASDGSAANEIYFSDLPWPIRKALHWNQRRVIRNKFELAHADALEKEKEVPSTYYSKNIVICKNFVYVIRYIGGLELHMRLYL